MSFDKDFAAVPELSPDPRIQIFRSLFSAPGEFDNMNVDAYAIVTQRFVVICDTLLCPNDMERACKLLSKSIMGRQMLVINSHADWDHVWGTHYLDKHYAPTIIGHEHCRTRLLSNEETEILRDYQKRFEVFRPVIIRPPTLTFRDTLTIYGGDLTLELFTAPGHQYDHLAIWIPEIKLLLAFDALEYPLPGIGSPELVPAMFATIEHFQQLQPAHVLCSHGNINSPTLIKHNLDYLREIEYRCRELLTQGQVIEEHLTDPASLIHYPYSEVVAHVHEPFDHTYYEYTHGENIRCILRWLLGQIA
jgi:glyoxylase-like metal-dependent hydrolase (beta-lactamase superfamily II)